MQHQNSCSGQVAVTCIIINTFQDKKVQGHGAMKHVKKKDTKLRTFPWYINQDNDIICLRELKQETAPGKSTALWQTLLDKTFLHTFSTTF